MADTSTIARPYAQALFDIAKRDDSLADWAQTLGALAQVVIDEDASAFLTRPDIDEEARVEFVSELGNQLGAASLLGSDRGRNLLRLLVENDRLSVLPDIASRFDALKAAAENTVKVTLISASVADDDVADKIARALEAKLGRSVDLKQEVDDELIGGALIRAEDMVIDGSVRTRLRKLAESLVS
jgi:F-type H+-transporting ATPase subunit delta